MSPECQVLSEVTKKTIFLGGGGLTAPLYPELLLWLAALANRSTSENFAPPRNETRAALEIDMIYN